MNSRNISTSRYSRQQICEALKYWKKLLKENYEADEFDEGNTNPSFDENAWQYVDEADDTDKDTDKDTDDKSSNAEDDTVKQAVEIIQQQIDVLKNSLGIEVGGSETNAGATDDFGDFDMGDFGADDDNDDKKSKKGKSKKDED